MQMYKHIEQLLVHINKKCLDILISIMYCVYI